MKTLLKISKLIPRLGTDNEHEKMATLLMIEKLFKLENISWTDVGLQLADFLTSTLGFVEAEAIEAKTSPSQAAPAQTGWQSAQGVHQSREENAIISIEQQLGFGIALTPKQQKVLETLSKRL